MGSLERVFREFMAEYNPITSHSGRETR